MVQKGKNDSRSVSSQGLLTVKLPKPTLSRSTSVFKALQQRKTVREISDKKLSLQVLSNLLWAAYGVNRKTGPFGIPGRTAASASNSQEIDLYIAMHEGIYLRALAIGPGQANFVAKAPVQIIYVVDVLRLTNTSGYQEPGLLDPEIQKSYYYVDTGLIAGNVYLFAASQGLASWFHNCNRSAFIEKLKLRVDQRVLFGHTIGYPAKKNYGDIK